MIADERETFTELFNRSQHRVYGYIITLLPNRDDAEEVFQETCLTVCDKWAEFDSTRDFVRWACGIAHNVARNYRRSKQRPLVTLSEGLLAEIVAERLESEPLLETRNSALSRCIEKLPISQRKVLERSYLGGEAIRSVAQRMGITPAALYLRLQRIRRTLFDCVDRALRAGGG